MEKYQCWSTSRFHPWFFVVFIFINDLTEGLTTNVKLCADDTSLFSVVHDTQTSAYDLNKGLEIINNWAFQWKMNFNPYLAKQPHEVIPGCHQNTARKKWTKEENKTAISCCLKATKESKREYRKRMYNLWNEMGMFEIEEQHLACQVRSIFKNKRLTENEIQQL